MCVCVYTNNSTKWPFLLVALVNGVDVPEGLYVPAGGEHDVLRARVLGDEVGDVVHAVAVRHPHAGLGVKVLPNILQKWATLVNFCHITRAVLKVRESRVPITVQKINP